MARAPVTHVYATDVGEQAEGVSRNIRALCRAMRAQGADVRLDTARVRLGDLNRRARLLRQGWASHAKAVRAADAGAALVHHHVSIPAMACFARLARWRRPGAPMLVQAWNCGNGPLPRLARRAPVPDAWAQRLFNGAAAARAGLAGIDDLVVSSAHQANQFREATDARIHVVPNGVDLATFRPYGGAERAAARQALGLGDGPVLLYYGHASPWKGVDVLLDALPQTLREVPDAQAFLALTPYGSQRPRLLRRIARQQGGQGGGRIHAAGLCDPPTLLAAADLCVLPAVAAVGTACHPNVLLEAMAAGLPVVATRLPPVEEVVASGRNGILVEPGDADALARAACALARDGALRRRLGDQARRDVEPRSWDAAARAMLGVYRRIGVEVPALGRARPLAAAAPLQVAR